MTLAGVKAKYVLLEPVDSSEVPPNSVFVESGTNQMNTKTSLGVPVPIVGDVTSYFVKQMEAENVFPQHTPLAKKSNGKVVPDDSDAPGQAFIGYAQQESVSGGSLIDVLLVGPNVEGAISGLGFVPGQQIYLSPVAGGYTNDASSLGDDDKIVKVGIADCAAGTASGAAVDLISFAEKLVEPT